VSNFVVASAAVLILAAISFTSQIGHDIVHNMPWAYLTDNLDVLASQTNSLLMPISLFAYELMVLNLVLGVFNLIPVPPLDGSHVLRHLLPEPVRRVYDTMGWFALLALVYFGGNFLGRLIFPVLGVFNSVLMSM
jgi:Zn-dependent protease